MGKKELSAFIASKKKEANKIDWNKRKNEWLIHLNSLYSDIVLWLEDYQGNGDILFNYEPIELNEEHIGIYECKRMKVRITSEEILLEPVGTLLIGAKGRVDVKGKNGTVKLVLVPEKSAGPKIKVIISAKEQKEKNQKKKEGDENLIWKIATPPPVITYTDLDGDSFSDALLEVIGG